MKIKNITSTVLISITVVISAVVLAVLAPLTLKDLLPESQPGDSIIGTAIGSVLMIIFGTILIYMPAIIITVANGLGLLFAARNLKSGKRPIKITNAVLCVLTSTILILAIIKMILWQCGM